MSPHSSRTVFALAASVTLLLSLAACSQAEPATSVGTDTATGDNATDAFPVTIDSAYGRITVQEKPDRVVALTAQHLDFLDALGVDPIASTVSASVPDVETMVTNLPWLADAETGDFDPSLTDADYKVSTEAVAAYEPDLILASTWMMDEALYTQLSEIAPVYVGPVVGNADWDVQLADIGALTGTTSAAESALADVADAYEKVTDAMPVLEGKTYNMLRYDGDAGFGIGNGSWLDGFGMIPAENQDNTQNASNISMENISQIDADVVAVWFYAGTSAEMLENPLFAQINAVTEGVYIPIEASDTDFANATNSAGPNSLLWAIDWITPIFEASPLVTG